MFKINSSINCVNLIPKDVARKLKNQKIKTTISEKNVPVKPSQPTCDCALTTCECDISNKPKKIECLNAKSCELDCSTDECDRKKKRQTIVLNAEDPYLPPLVDTRKLKKEVNCLCVQCVIPEYEKSLVISIQSEKQYSKTIETCIHLI